MKRSFYLLLVFSALFVTPAFSQDLTGIWRGYFKTELGDTYKLEIQIKQTNAGFKGVTYSYLTTVFYGKAVLTGDFNKNDKSAMIKEIRTVELRMSPGSVSCIMKYLLDYSKSGKEEFLEGVYSSVYEKDGYGGKRGDDCGGGIVRLRKVPTSDFYIEPFLRDEPVASRPPANQPRVNQSPVKQQPSTLVPNQKTTTNKNTVAKNNPPKKDPAPEKKNNVVVNTIPDSAKTTKPDITKAPVKQPVLAAPITIRNRKNDLMKSLVINSPRVTVKLFDNGEIDDDTISVYLDNTVILANKRLSAQPLTFTFTMSEDNPEQQLTMVAENLGRIPPNTSLMIVEAGKQRFDVRITSTEQKNAIVRFRYEPE